MSTRLFSRAHALLWLVVGTLSLLGCSETNIYGDPPNRDASSSDNGRDVSAGGDGTTDVPDTALDARADSTEDASATDVGADAEDVRPADDVADASVTDTPAPDASLEDTRPDVDARPQDDAEACVEIAYEAGEANRPADIIWVIDSSESMDDEIGQVQANINAFAALIDASGVDVRVVMIASKYDDNVEVELPIPIPLPIPIFQSYYGVCVPPPLSAAPGCPDTDNPPAFVHPHVNVYSTDALTRLFESYPLFRDVLRPWAKTHIVAVTDDSSELSASEFTSRAAALSGPGFTDLAFHSIVDITGTTCGDGAGDDYVNLSSSTGGVVQSICLSDWSPIFDALFEEVLAGAQIPCAFAIPAPPEDAEIVPDEVNVYLSAEGGEPELVRYVERESACTLEGGWYYDNPDDPQIVYLCPAVCGEDREGSVDIAFGCRTVKV